MDESLNLIESVSEGFPSYFCSFLVSMGVAMHGTICTRTGIFWLESVIMNKVDVSKCCTSLLLPQNVDKQTVSVPSTGSCSSLAKFAVKKDF